MHERWNNGVGVAAAAVFCLVLGATGGAIFASATFRNAGIISDYQDLIGGLVGGALTLTAAWVAWFAVQTQVRQSERQFRHQMAVSTARDRAAIQRSMEVPLEDIAFLRRLVADCAPLIRSRQFVIAARHWAGFGKVQQSIDSWLDAADHEVATGLFEPGERVAVERLVARLRLVARFGDTLSENEIRDLDALARMSDDAEAALRSVLRRVDSWVPA